MLVSVNSECHLVVNGIPLLIWVRRDPQSTYARLGGRGGHAKAYVPMLNSYVRWACRGEGGQFLTKIMRTYFMDDPLPFDCVTHHWFGRPMGAQY
jgi:hypothetical protein